MAVIFEVSGSTALKQAPFCSGNHHPLLPVTLFPSIVGINLQLTRAAFSNGVHWFHHIKWVWTILQHSVRAMTCAVVVLNFSLHCLCMTRQFRGKYVFSQVGMSKVFPKEQLRWVKKVLSGSINVDLFQKIGLPFRKTVKWLVHFSLCFFSAY